LPRNVGKWMPDAELFRYYDDGVPLADIALLNERYTGWKPTKGTVQRRVIRRLGANPRNYSHAELMPQPFNPAHSNSAIHNMLESESKRRQGAELTADDRANLKTLRDLLFHREHAFVICYDYHLGFYFLIKQDKDKDIIRYHPL
jgi:hypothetical protein